MLKGGVLPLRCQIRQRLLGIIAGSHLHMKASDCLEAIDRLDTKLNAVVHKEPNACSEPASDSGRDGSIQDMCVLVKDSIDVKGMPTVVGDKERVGAIADNDAPLVKRMRDAGAIILGKTNVPAGCLDLQTFNKVFGTTNNPYDLSRTPGGSTGGGAAAVAAGMVPLALGSDLSGSLRVPASFCGVASIRPTEKRLPTGGHTPGAYCDQSNFALGAIADSTATLNTFMSACCPVFCDRIGQGTTMLCGGYRVYHGATQRDHDHVISRSSSQQVCQRSRLKPPSWTPCFAEQENFGQQLESWGIEVHRTAPDLDSKNLFRAHKLFSELAVTVSAPAGNPLKRDQSASSPSAQQLANAEQIRDQHRQILHDFLGGAPYTAWVMPTAGVVAFPHNPEHAPIDVDGTDYPYWQPLLGYVFQASTCGNPVVTIPIAMAGHLPVGVQVIGRMWEDEQVLAVAGVLEMLLEDPIPPPPLHINRA